MKKAAESVNVHGFVKYMKATIQTKSADSDGVRWELFSALVDFALNDTSLTY